MPRPVYASALPVPSTYLANRRSLPSRLWPIGLNAFLFLVLVDHCWETAGPNSLFISLFTLVATVTNTLGILIALLRRRWALAAWYGLALMLLIAAVTVALAYVEIPWNKDE